MTFRQTLRSFRAACSQVLRPYTGNIFILRNTTLAPLLLSSWQELGGGSKILLNLNCLTSDENGVTSFKTEAKGFIIAVQKIYPVFLLPNT
jgi:hypothetical protein